LSDFEIKIINPSGFENWNTDIQNFDSYSFFHTLEWCQVLTSTYEYIPTYFCIIKNKKLSSVVPAMEINSKLTGKRLISLPFSDFCEPIFSSIDESETLKKSMLDYCRKHKLRYMEFRTSETRFPYETEYFRTDLRHLLEISADQQIIQKQFSENTKRNIKAAIKEGVNIKELNSVEGIKIFYELQCITRRKHGLPPQPKLFFDNIYRFIISKDKGQILIGYFKDKPVAALMFFTFGEKVIYKFGASLADSLPKGSNHFLMWEAIKKFNNAGYKEFDFGRTETNHDGLRRFKLGFGAEERIIYTSRFDVKKNSFLPVISKSTGSYNQIFKKLPLPILKLIGKTIYKHVG